MTAGTCVVQEQLKQDVASLQKQLASQKRKFEEETKVQEQVQEAHEKELRHLKRDIKHKQVGLPQARKERTTPFSIDLMRSLVMYQATTGWLDDHVLCPVAVVALPCLLVLGFQNLGWL